MSVLGNPRGEFLDLLLGEKELAVTEMINIKNVAFLVWGDVHIANKGLTMFDEDIGVADGRVLGSEALDFGTSKNESGCHEVA